MEKEDRLPVPLFLVMEGGAVYLRGWHSGTSSPRSQSNGSMCWVPFLNWLVEITGLAL
ncbi:hypothetical protein BH20ACT15_BH20ACT15_03640 [soil metagenome]